MEGTGGGEGETRAGEGEGRGGGGAGSGVGGDVRGGIGIRGVGDMVGVVVIRPVIAGVMVSSGEGVKPGEGEGSVFMQDNKDRANRISAIVIWAVLKLKLMGRLIVI